METLDTTALGNPTLDRLKKKVVFLGTGLALLAICPPAAAAPDGDYLYETNAFGITITGYTGSGGNVSIPYSIDELKVTEIGTAAFRACETLTGVILPDAVTNLAAEAFSMCSSLTNVFLPDCVAAIGSSAFFGCDSLTGVTLPEALTSLGQQVFSDCDNLAAITVTPANPAYSSLGGVLFNKLQTTLVCCPGSKTGTYVLPGSVTNVGSFAFYACRHLTGITLQEGLLSIDTGAFSQCWTLTGVTFPDSVTSIGDAAFSNCRDLSSVTLGRHINRIGKEAFSECHSLPAMIFPRGLASIGEKAFLHCINLTTVIIPETVTSIGVEAFRGCNCLTAIQVDADNPVYSSVDGVLFNKLQTTIIQCPRGKTGMYSIPSGVLAIGDSAFSECTGLTGVTVADTTVTIGNRAFLYCIGLARIRLPSGITAIGEEAFARCYSLTDLTIPEQVATIGDDAFFECGCLTTIAVDPANPVYSSLDGVLFNKLRSTILRCPEGKTGCYVMPDSVTEIGKAAFLSCSKLTEIIIPDSVAVIGESAFSDCSSLTSIALPRDVKTVEFATFAECDKLVRVIVGRGVTEIGSAAFGHCPMLQRVYCTGDAPSHGDNIFTNNLPAVVYYFPDTAGWGPTYADHPAVLWNPDFDSITFSNGITTCMVRGTPDIPVSIDTTTNLLTGVWTRLAVCTITNETISVTDTNAIHCPSRFYRISTP